MIGNITDTPLTTIFTGNESLSTVAPPSIITTGNQIDSWNRNVIIHTLLPALVYVIISIIVGVIGNTLVLYIYYFKKSLNTSRAFILALAAFDLLNCLLSMTTEVALLINFVKFDQPFVCKSSRFLTAFCNNSTTVVLIAIAVDRYRKICKPFTRSFSLRVARRIIFSAVIFGVITALPMIPIYGTQTLVMPYKNFKLVGKTCLIDDSMLKTKYPIFLIAFIFICHLLSDIILITLYCCMGTAICRQTKVRRSLKENFQMNDAEHKEQSTSTDEIRFEQNNEDAREIHDNRLAKNLQLTKSSHQNKATNRVLDMRKRYGNRSISEHGSFDKGRKFSLLSMTASLRRRRSSESSEGSMSKGRASKTTVMLFLVTVVFIVTFLPFCVIVSMRVADNNIYYKLTNTGRAFYQLFLRSYFLQSVLNPIVYCFVSRHFRLQLLALCKR